MKINTSQARVDSYIAKLCEEVTARVDTETLRARFSLAQAEDVYRSLSAECMMRAASLKKEDGR